ncbi:MAG: hypothetical protein ACT4QC_05485 [Planctomycetaceae bacterium]
MTTANTLRHIQTNRSAKAIRDRWCDDERAFRHELAKVRRQRLWRLMGRMPLDHRQSIDQNQV